MRKTFFYLFAFMAVSAMIFTGCKKDEEKSSPATIDLSKSATLTGLVWANLSLYNDTAGLKLEAAPQGTKIQFQIDASQFPLDPTGTYDDMIYTATVGADGKYTISVPTTNRGINLTIRPVEFTYDQTQVKWGGSYWITDGTKRKIYTTNPVSVTNLVTGHTQIEDFTYSNN
jgi:hypothetical protein